MYGLSALTLVTAQNSTGIQALQPLPTAFIGQQIDSVLTDIGADAIKTGLLLRADVITLVAEKAAQYGPLPLIVDPVLVDGRGQPLVAAEALDAYRLTLFPRALIVTPNRDEAALLTGHAVDTLDDLHQAARALTAFGVCYALVKGGHLPGDSVIDVLYDRERDHMVELRAPRLARWNARGTGCTFASAIAAEVAKGAAVPDAVRIAKDYVTGALQAASGWTFGAGRGTVWHGFRSVS